MAELVGQYMHPSALNLSWAQFVGNDPSAAVILPYTLVNNLRTFTHPKLQKGPAAVTSISSTTKQMRKRPGWEDPGQFTFTAYRDLGLMLGTFLSFYAAEILLSWTITLPNTGTETFTGYFDAITPLGNVDRDSNEELFDEYGIQITDSTFIFVTGV